MLAVLHVIVVILVMVPAVTAVYNCCQDLLPVEKNVLMLLFSSLGAVCEPLCQDPTPAVYGVTVAALCCKTVLNSSDPDAAGCCNILS